jgi:hypothetical protein
MAFRYDRSGDSISIVAREGRRGIDVVASDRGADGESHRHVDD